jgi:hypothetical protein
LLIEESRTNALLNSLLDGTSLATQTVVVTAAARTLSFYGTGQIVLSGAHSATVTGTGPYPARTTLTFTPSIGTLTLTVTGTVQFANLELGSFATSFIPTAASQVTRNADVATMTGTNFSDWYNASEGAWSITFDSTIPASDDNTTICSFYYDANYRILNYLASTNSLALYVKNAGSATGLSTSGGYLPNTVINISSAYKTNSFAIAVNGATPVASGSGTLPSTTPIALSIGSAYGTSAFINSRS